MSSHPIDHFDDSEIDALFPDTVRRVAGIYWTPVAVARRVARILEEHRVRRVLDVGSGPGKFCVVAGARAPSVKFAGIEQRPHLVAVARALAAHLEVGNVGFEVGDATSVSWRDFDAFYVFNSFAENSFRHEDRFDATVELSRKRRVDDVLRVERWLATVRTGALLVTYHGLGGPIPATFECVQVEPAGSGWVRIWRKAKQTVPDQYWVEDGEDVHAMTASQVGLYLLEHSIEGPIAE